MKLSKQVISLEQAKRLKELGVYGSALFYYEIFEVSGKEDYHLIYIGIGPFPNNHGFIPAYTVAELGEVLSSFKYETHGFPMFLSDAHCDDFVAEKIKKWQCGYRNAKNPEINTDTNAPTEAEARAAMLIHLLESNLTTAAEVNERLNQ